MTGRSEEKAEGFSSVLACAMPARPVVRRLTLSVEAQGPLSVCAWLGSEDEGAQLEMLGSWAEAWEPWLVTLGGLDAGANLAGVIAERFSVSDSEAAGVERLMWRSGAVGSIAMEAGGIEALRELELRVRDRLAILQGSAA